MAHINRSFYEKSILANLPYNRYTSPKKFKGDICHKTSCQRFEANQARLKRGLLAYNLLHMIRQSYVWGEEVRRSIDWLIKRLIKVGARVSYHARRWYVHVASAFPLAHHYRSVLA
jgi:hypothetical protein